MDSKVVNLDHIVYLLDHIVYLLDHIVYFSWCMDLTDSIVRAIGRSCSADFMFTPSRACLDAAGAATLASQALRSTIFRFCTVAS